MGCVAQKQPPFRPAQPSNGFPGRTAPQPQYVKVENGQKGQSGPPAELVVGSNTVNNQKQTHLVSTNARTGDQRRQQLLSKYQIDNLQKVPNVPKMHTYNYQALLVHNPDHNADDNYT